MFAFESAKILIARGRAHKPTWPLGGRLKCYGEWGAATSAGPGRIVDPQPTG